MRKHCYFLFLLLSSALVSLSACIDATTTFGADFVPDDQKPRVFIYNFDNIPFYTDVIDSINTQSTYGYTAVFGNINVAPFGNMKADAVFRIYPYVADHSFGDAPEFVSADLILHISGRNYPDDSQANIVQNVRLYRLNKLLSYDSTYYNNSITSNDYDPTPINLPGTTYNGGDTLVIPLTKAFGDSLLSATANDMDSLLHFYNRYKGFVLAVDTLPDGIAGGRLQTTDISTAMLVLKYKDNGKDTVMYYYGDYGLVFSTYKHSSAHLANNVTPGPTVYYEGLAGVKPVFDLAAIADTLQNWVAQQIAIKSIKNVLINKAELLVSIDYPVSNLDKCPKTLALAYRDVTAEGKLTYTLISDAASSAFGGNINRSTVTYSFNIAHYLQETLKLEGGHGKTTLYLLPTTIVQDSYGYSYTILDNTTYAYGLLNGTGSASPVQLKFTYTLLY